MNSAQIRTIAGVVAAMLAYLQAQTDITVLPVFKVLIGALLVGLAAIDWGALFGKGGTQA